MNRRGFVGDVAFIVGVLLAVVIIFIIGARLFSDVNDEFQASDQLDANSKNITNTLESRYVTLFDGIFAMVFGLLAVALIISVAALGSRPEFFFITVVISLFIVGLAAILSNFFNTFTNGALATTASSFTFAPLIMNNLVDITLFLVAILMIGLFVKGRGVV